MKNIVIGLATAALLLLSSCEDYLDVNQNPNEATAATPELVLPSVLQGIASRANVDVNTDFPQFMGYWSHADGWSGWFDIKQYLITTNNQQAFFNTPYSGYLMDIAFMEKNATGALDQNYQAIAKILKSYVYQQLVDAYGDVPYSQANSGIASPVYDDGQAVYDSLVANLDAAVAIIDANPDANAPGGDFLFNGDMDLWKQFANTLKLKILLRQAYVTGFTPPASSVLDAMDFLATDARFNPGYSATNMSPYYATYGFTATGALTNGRTQFVMNAYIEGVYNALNDTRKFRTFDAAISNGIYHGKPFGFEGDGSSNLYNKDNGNLIGAGLVKKDVTATQGALIMSKFESLFLQAEAAERGWITTSTPKSLYEDAVNASFAFLGIADSAAAYMAQDLDGIQYDLAPVKLDLIINQKYIAFCGVSGFEAWCEYRRTGLPDVKESDATASMLSYYAGIGRREIPHLLYYPQREFNLNKVNTPAAAASNYGKAQDASYHWDARVFWDVTPVK
jgi:hypothetical protein